MAPCRLCAAALLALALAQNPAPAELSNSTICDSLGFPSLDGYLLRLPLASPYGRTSSAPVFRPVYATLPAGVLGETVYGNVTAAVIYIHGLTGAANEYFCSGAAAGAAHDGVLSLAPWFGSEQVTAAVWGAPAGEDGVSAFWGAASRWLTGGNTFAGADGASPQTRYSTAFDALDALVAALRDGGGFPNLEIITVAGFSAGAQLASRYAFASPASLPPAPGAVAVRVIVSDPASFMYVDGRRPAPACRPLRDTGDGWQCAEFDVPPEAPDCADYDVYKYGVNNASYLNGYMALFDKDPALRAETIRAFAAKDVAYIFGTGDACNCNAPGFANKPSCYIEGMTCLPDAAGGPGCCDTAPDGMANMVDVSCEAMVQGSNRLQRGILFTDYLRAFYDEAGVPFAHRRFFGAFAHNNSGMYASEAFQQLAFKV